MSDMNFDAEAVAKYDQQLQAATNRVPVERARQYALIGNAEMPPNLIRQMTDMRLLWACRWLIAASWAGAVIFGATIVGIAHLIASFT